jgi:hypothetical protein
MSTAPGTPSTRRSASLTGGASWSRHERFVETFEVEAIRELTKLRKSLEVVEAETKGRRIRQLIVGGGGMSLSEIERRAECRGRCCVVKSRSVS